MTGKRWSKTNKRRTVRRIMKRCALHSYGNKRIYRMHWGDGGGLCDFRYTIKDDSRNELQVQGH